MTTVIIAEDQKLLRESFKNIIENNSDIKVIACATNGNEAYNLCKEYKPDVVLMDLSMPICNGNESTKLIKSEFFYNFLLPVMAVLMMKVHIVLNKQMTMVLLLLEKPIVINLECMICIC